MVRAVALVVAAFSPGQAVHLRSIGGASEAYEDFRRSWGGSRSDDATSYAARVALFEQRREEVIAHNARPGITWKAAVNRFADYTDAEFQQLLGHRSSRSYAFSHSASQASFLELEKDWERGVVVGSSMDWRQLGGSSRVKDQGSCGSCWAVAAVGALELHLEMAANQTSPDLSFEELVDCVENPDECGGTGGCKGATAELAFQYVQEHGLGTKDSYHGYQSGGDGTCKRDSRRAVATGKFVRLPENKYEPLLQAASKGPVVVSASATNWMMYSEGVYNGCDKNAIINHAILLMGYGTDTEHGDYWLIRNSWGSKWGESGFIRLKRGSDEQFCGIDDKPQEGVGCKGGPATMTVCGMCGVLADSAYPTNVRQM